MATGTFLASSLVMGLVAASAFFLVARGRAWERYYPSAVGTARSTRDRLEGGNLLLAIFVLLSIAAIGGVLLVLEGAASSTLLIFAGAGIAVVGFLVLGTYAAARSRGQPHAHAVGTAVGVLGGVVLLVIVGNLLTQFGA